MTLEEQLAKAEGTIAQLLDRLNRREEEIRALKEELGNTRTALRHFKSLMSPSSGQLKLDL